MKNVLLSLNFPTYGLSVEDTAFMDDRTLIVIKWNWEYSQAHAFQKECVKVLQEHPRMRFLIACSHPKVFTMGRGLQRPKKGQTLNLTEFNGDESLLPYPLHRIERGGGLTFHHPGQFIFYPIVKLNPKTLSLSTMINDIFSMTSEVLSQWNLPETDTGHELLGLWKGNKKLASMGIAIDKLTTYHGMALNFFTDHEMKSALSSLNPCGINAGTYASVDDYVFLPEGSLERFTVDFFRKVKDVWE
jgi:lipoyl(octanoyl) transferase